MKKLILITAIAIMATQVYAQRGGLRGPSIEKMQQELDLTDAQMDELNELKAELLERKKEFKNSGERPTPEQRDAMKTEHKEKMLAILTPAQIEKLNALKDERKENRKSEREETKAKFKEAKQEMKTYRENEVMPVLLEQRQKLDELISTQDKVTIEKLRPVVAQHKAEMKAAHQEKKEDWKKQKGQLSDAEKKEHMKRKHQGMKKGHRGADFINQFKENYPTEADQLIALEEKYRADINLLMDEIETERAEWKATKKETYQSVKGDRKKRKGKKSQQNTSEDRESKKEAHKAKKQKAKRIGFLLMDPDMESKNAVTTPLSTGKIHNTQVFPNPSNNDQTLEFNVAKSGNVLVEIIDKKGKVIKRIHDGQMTSGNQIINVDISDLQGYVFYYRITDSSGTSTTQFMTKQ